MIRLLVALAVLSGSRTAVARDCYEIAAGTALYGDVMGETEVGTATEDVVGWFGSAEARDPTVRVKLVAVAGEVASAELLVHVKKEEARAVACPSTRWKRDPDAIDLTWRDARRAGSATKAAIAKPRRKAKKKHGRACFAAPVPGVRATVCADVAARARPACVSIAAGKPVFARPVAAAKYGATTEKVVAEQRARVDDMLAVRVLDTDDSFETYVRVKDAKRARCPEPDDVAYIRAAPTEPALLPDGTDAGFRFDPDGFATDIERVEVGGRTLECHDHSPVRGLALRVCTRP